MGLELIQVGNKVISCLNWTDMLIDQVLNIFYSHNCKVGNYGKIPDLSWAQKVMLPLILATPTLYTPFPPHRGSTEIFMRIKSDTSSGQRNLPVLLRFRHMIFTAETRWIHRH